MRTLVDLALTPEHRRGHGALYGGLNHGRIDLVRPRRALVEVSLPRAADGRLVLAVDVSPWLRPDANTCATRAFCHTFGRGEGQASDGAGLAVLGGRCVGGPAARLGRRCWTRSAWSQEPMSPR
ncbi:transposase [Streptomyces sp900105755]|uniref:transposase n=1 Tax=Streptomyces sp. 900105755 TaxID=3154389 RepID=UPI00331F78BB